MVTRASREWRRIAVLTGDHRYDLAIPLDDSLDVVVRRLGLGFVPGRHLLVDRTGRETSLAARGADLDDGSLLTIVDLSPAGAPSRSRAARPGDGDAERGSVWWMLGIAGALVATLVLVDAGVGILLPDVAVRILAGILLAGAAAGSALLWVMRRPADRPRDGLVMLAPLVIAFAGGAIIVPPMLVGAAQLAVTAGLLAAGIVAALLAVALEGPRLRAGARMATVVLLVLALIWGATLFAGWGMLAAAAISAGVVPLGLRGLPSTLLEVAEGYHIDYRHFMSSRWTVRGAIPEDPGPVDLPVVRSEVAEAAARLLVGTLLLAATPALVVPLVLPGLVASDPFVFGGTIGLLCAIVLALLLVPRHTAQPVLRWAPRIGAVLVVAEVAISVALSSPPLLLTLVGAGSLVLGLIAAALVVPVGRGAGSLGWSRLADLGEWLAVALALPAALLAADGLDVLRGMMAG
jgi:hypothetical protein